MQSCSAGNKSELQVQFRNIDKNKDGFLSYSELETILGLVGVANNPNIKAIIDKFDGNGDGKLTFDDFVRMVNENDNEARASEEEIKMIQNAFNNFDVNGDGFMSKGELKSLLQKMGSGVTDLQVETLFHEADINNDGRIDLEEFVKVMRKNSN